MGYMQKIAAVLALGALSALSPAVIFDLLPVHEDWANCEAASYVDASLRPVQLAVNTHHTIDIDTEGGASALIPYHCESGGGSQGDRGITKRSLAV